MRSTATRRSSWRRTTTAATSGGCCWTLRKVLADGVSEADAIASLSPEEKGFAKSKRAKAERKSTLIKTELLR